MPKASSNGSVLDAQCPSRLVLDRIADKWTALIIQVLAHGTAGDTCRVAAPRSGHLCRKNADADIAQFGTGRSRAAHGPSGRSAKSGIRAHEIGSDIDRATARSLPLVGKTFAGTAGQPGARQSPAPAPRGRPVERFTDCAVAVFMHQAEIVVLPSHGGRCPGGGVPNLSCLTRWCLFWRASAPQFRSAVARSATEPRRRLPIFLPAIIYPAALFTSWRDFRRNLRPILCSRSGLCSSRW